MEIKRIDDLEVEPVPSTRPLDRFGFVKQDVNDSTEGLSKGRSAHEFEREERKVRKWRKMIGVGGGEWKHYVRRKPQVVKRRIRKGIPDCLRGLVWQLISGSRNLLLMNPGVYEDEFATGYIRDFGIIIGYNARYFAYLSITCFFPAETRTWSKITLQCSESIFCVRPRYWLCSGNGFLSRFIASLYERRGCILVVGCITERSCPCSYGRTISGWVTSCTAISFSV